jgi:hypothetical protein
MINIITPLYRYDNVPLLYDNITSLTNDFKWHLIEGSNKVGSYDISEILKDNRVKYYKIETKFVWGHEQRNYFVTDIKANDNEWCYFLDDDNFLTEDLVSELGDDKSDFILFSQKAGLTEQIRLWGSPGRIGLGLNDIGNFIIKYNFLKHHPIYHLSERNGDGHFGDDIKQYIDQYKFKFLEDKFTRYNCLSKEIF